MIKFFLFGSGAFLTYSLMFFFFPYLKKNIIDKPNLRSSHKKATPSGGGLSFVLGSCLLIQFINRFNLLALLPLAFIGYLDDKYNVPSWLRYVTQLLTITFIFNNSEIKDYLLKSISNSLLITIFTILILIIGTALINFINFMDGIDCLIGSCLLIALLTLGLINNNYESLILSGCLLGFIPWNFSPAKVFMGDVGSTFLGGYYAMVVFNSPNFTGSLLSLLIIFPILVDPIITIILRFQDKQNIFTAHRLHLYQRLNLGGFSHIKIVCIYLSTIIINSTIYALFDNIFLVLLNIVWIMLGIFLNKRYASPFIFTQDKT